MINFLSTWVKNLSLVIVIVSILGMLLPNNKTKKYIKMVMGLYILFSIISPFVKNKDVFSIDVEKIYKGNSIETLSNGDDNMKMTNKDKTQNSDNIQSQNTINSRLEKLYEQKLENDITQKLEKQGYELDECNVKTYIKDSSKELDTSNSTWIEQINIKVSNKSNNKKETDNVNDNNTKNDKKSKESAESVLVNEIQKIKKVDVNILNNNLKDGINSSSSNDSNEQNSEKTNLTANDIQNIKQFLIKEYGVDEKCLRIS